MINILIPFCVVYLGSAISVQLIFKFHTNYTKNIISESLTYKDGEFARLLLTFFPLMNTFVVLNYIWNMLKWLFKIK